MHKSVLLCVCVCVCMCVCGVCVFVDSSCKMTASYIVNYIIPRMLSGILINANLHYSKLTYLVLISVTC